MTQEEKQEIINAVLSAILTNSKTIEQLTPTESLSDDDAIEVSGGRRISYAAFLSAVQEGVQLMLNGYLTGEAAVAWFAALENNPANYVGAPNNPVQLHWRQSPIVLLDSMGEDLDGDDDFTAQVGDKWWDPSNDNSRNYIFLKTSTGQAGWPIGSGNVNDVLYVNKRTGRMYLWDGTDMVELVGATGGGGSIIKDVKYENGYLVFTFDTEQGDEVVSVPVDFDASNYVPITRTVNGKALSSNVTIGMSDIQGLVDAINNAGSGAVSVTTNQDGTFVIHVGSTDYTINLNHTHDDMVKLVVEAGEDLPDPEDMSEDTIYGAVEDGEITVIYLGGYPFYGGGGGSSTPRLISPANGSTIECGTNQGSGVEKTITVKGANLTAALTVAVTGTGFSIKNGTSSISAADANAGTTLTIVYSGTSADATGTLSFTSSTDGINSSMALEADYEDPYTGIEYDKACRYRSSTTDIATVAGYCMTPKYAFPVNHQLKIHFGFKDASSAGTKYGAAGWKTADGSGNPAACFTSDAGDANTERNIPTSSGNNGNPPYTFIAATFKTSELDNCFLYDLTSQEWLFAGVNVDKSNPPT